jgi:hypothetical protein
METLIFFCGIFNLLFLIFHAFFWKLFDWKKNLNKLMFHNKAIMQVLNLKLMYVFLFFAAICFFFTNELLYTNFGNYILIVISIFWLTRFVEQLVFFNNKSVIEKLLILIFAIGTIIHIAPLIFL